MIDKTNNVKGYFKYTLRDAKTNEILKQYEEPNQIMAEVPKMYFELVSGLATPNTVDTVTTLKPEDFRLCSIVLGNQGVTKLLGPTGLPVLDGNGDEVYVPKKINPLDKNINAMKAGSNGEAYQATWKQLTEESKARPVTAPKVGLTLQTEGLLSGTFNGPALNGSTGADTETGLDVVTTVKDGVITFGFSLLAKTGNANGGIDFSEAALFVRHNQDKGFQDGTALTPNADGTYNLGTIFSMKTFDPVHKSNACTLELEWKLDFNL